MRKQIGTVFVDAGLIWVGDPCYVMGDDSTNRVTDWQAFCRELETSGQYDNSYSAPLGLGVGLAIESGFGDGEYPVFVEFSDEGDWGSRVKSVTIEFIGDDDETK